ncbi:MAG: TIGR00266 family protein [Leptospirales bacterium]
MKIDIKFKPSFAQATVTLDDGEGIKSESGAMVAKSDNVSIETHKAQKGGLFKSIKSALLGGESFWMNTFTANNGSGEVKLAPTLPGDIAQVDLANQTLFVQSTGFLASTPAIEMDTKFQGLKGFFSGESLFFLKLSGTGPLLLSSFGGIDVMDVDGTFIIDTGHVVAFEDSLNYEVTKFGGWKSFFLGGEGIVAKFKGNGKVWIQTRNVPGLGKWLRSNLPPKR